MCLKPSLRKFDGNKLTHLQNGFDAFYMPLDRTVKVLINLN